MARGYKSIIEAARDEFVDYDGHSEKTQVGLFGPEGRPAAEVDRVFEALLQFETIESLTLKFNAFFAGSENAPDLLEALIEAKDSRVRTPRIASLRTRGSYGL